MTPNQIVLRYERLRGERKNLDYQWELIERFIIPGRGRFFQEGFDQEESINWRHRELYDQTAQGALVNLAASIHANLTSDSSRWFQLKFDNLVLNDHKEASEWIEECTDIVHNSFHVSNLNTVVNEFYQDAGGFGTAVMIHEEDEEAGALDAFGGHIFATPMAREIYFEEDWHGRPIGLYRRREYTSIQLVDKFGLEAVPQHIQAMMENEQANAKHDVIFAIYPKEYGPDETKPDRSAVLSVDRRPWEAKFILYSEARAQLGPTLGYHEMPAYVLRWSSTAGSKFGHSPGIIALSDVLTVNQLVEILHKATEKAVDPPMKAVQRGVLSDLEQFAGGVTMVRTPDALQPLVDPRHYRLDVGFADLNDIRERIRRVFFEDQLQLKESPAMTATEVIARRDLMQRILGPTLGRIRSDFLDQLIDNSFWMMNRKGAFPPAPDIVQEMEGTYGVEYMGPLARAQRMHEVDSIERWIVANGQMAQVNPDVLDNVEFDEASRHSAKVMGVPSSIVRSESDRNELRRKREAQRQQEIAVATAREVAAGMKDAAAAGVDMSQAGGVGGLVQ